eukprot:PhF_6_TR8258/c0_g1_i1/m.12560
MDFQDEISESSSLETNELEITRYGNNVAINYVPHTYLRRDPSTKSNEENKGEHCVFGYQITETESYGLPSPTDGGLPPGLHDPTVEELFQETDEKHKMSAKLMGVVCVLLGPTSTIRKGCMRFVSHPSTSSFILCVNVINCIFLSTANPSSPTPMTYFVFTRTVEKISISLYCLELAMHILAKGSIESPLSYFRYSLFNVVDGNLILWSAWGYILDEEALKHLHAGRAFRWFLLFQRPNVLFSNNKAVMETIKHSIDNLIRACMFLIFFFLVFSILGVEAFKGSYSRRCFVGNVTVVPPLFCKDKPSELFRSGCPDPKMTCKITESPNNGMTSFDHVGVGLLVLTNVATFNNWGTFLYPLMEAENEILPVCYFFAFIIAVAFIVFNLFPAVISSRYFAIKKHYRRQLDADPTSAVLTSLVPFLIEMGPLRRALRIPHWTKTKAIGLRMWRLWSGKPVPILHRTCHATIRSRPFRFLVQLSILINIVMQCGLFEHETYEMFLVDLTFTVLLWIEIAFKVLGAGTGKVSIYGFARYTHNYWNILDVSLVLLSTVTLIVHRQGWTFLRMVRTLRALRLIDSKGPQRLLNSMLAAVRPLAQLSVFFLLSVFIIASIAIPVFATEWTPSYELANVPVRENFDTYGGAILTLFTIITSEKWTNALYFTYPRYPVFSPFFFLLVYAGFTLVLVNIFTAIVLEHLQFSAATENSRREKVVFAQIREHFFPKKRSTSFSESIASLHEWLNQISRKFMDVLYDEDDEAENVVSSPKYKIAPTETASYADLTRTASFQSPRAKRWAMKKVNEKFQQQEELYIAELCAERNQNEIEMENVLPGGIEMNKTVQQPPWVVDDSSLYIFKSNNPIRRLCISIVSTHKIYFQTVILLVILASCVTLAMDPPVEAFVEQELKSQDQASWIVTADTVFIIMFLMEAIIKIIANGFYFGIEQGQRIPYIRDNWNRLDFLLLVTMMISTFFPNIRAIRLLRAFRPFKLVRRSMQFRVLFSAIVRSATEVIHAMFFVVFFVVVFGIVGFKLFNGKLESCNDNHPLITRKDLCVGNFFNSKGLLVPRVWKKPASTFDSISSSMLTVFEISTLTDWTTTLYSVTDIVGKDIQPIRSYSSYYAVYFVSLIIVQSFFLSNVFVGLLLICFDAERGKLSLTPYQQEWLQIRSQVNLSAPFRIRWYYYLNTDGLTLSRIRKYASMIVLHPYFDWISTAVVLLNVFLMASVHADQPDYWQTVLLVTDVLFLIYYVTEIVLKVIVMYPRVYFEDNWNKFDVTVVVGSVLVYIIEASATNARDVSILVIKALSRFFRMLRVLKLAKSNIGNLQFLFATLVQSLPSILSVCVLLFVVLFISALFATNLFGNVRFHTDINRNANFRSLGSAMLTLMRMLTSDGWNSIMHDVSLTYPYCTTNDQLNDCGDENTADVFFLAYGVIGTLIFLPIVMAIIIDNFNMCYSQFSYAINLADLALFRREFERVMATKKIERESLTHEELQTLICILHAMDSPLVRDIHPSVKKFNYRRILFDLEHLYGTTWNELKVSGSVITSQDHNDANSLNFVETPYTYDNVLAVLVTHQGGAESLSDPIDRAERRKYERNRDESIANALIAKCARRWLRHDVWPRDPKKTIAYNHKKAHVWRNLDLFCSYAIWIAKDRSLPYVVKQVRHEENVIPAAEPVKNPIQEVFGDEEVIKKDIVLRRLTQFLHQESKDDAAEAVTVSPRSSIDLED